MQRKCRQPSALAPAGTPRGSDRSAGRTRGAEHAAERAAGGSGVAGPLIEPSTERDCKEAIRLGEHPSARASQGLRFRWFAVLRWSRETGPLIPDACNLAGLKFDEAGPPDSDSSTSSGASEPFFDGDVAPQVPHYPVRQSSCLPSTPQRRLSPPRAPKREPNLHPHPHLAQCVRLVRSEGRGVST